MGRAGTTTAHAGMLAAGPCFCPTQGSKTQVPRVLDSTLGFDAAFWGLT
jgi:hypothetical protein